MINISDIAQIRAYEPESIAQALRARTPGPALAAGEKMMIIAADHPARGALGAGADSFAMSNRKELLERCAEALKQPGVTGFLGTADVIEDLALIGALEGKHVYGSMNRAGVAGAAWEMDDRFNCYTPQGICEAHLDGGKSLLRINYTDPAIPSVLRNTALAVNELADHHKMMMIEPFVSNWHEGRIVNDLSTEAVIASMAIASGLGTTSAYTWLKIPCVPDMERVMSSTTLPTLILGGAVPQDPQAALSEWAKALELPGVYGIVAGRSMLFPADDDVAQAVRDAVSLL